MYLTRLETNRLTMLNLTVGAQALHYAVGDQLLSPTVGDQLLNPTVGDQLLSMTVGVKNLTVKDISLVNGSTLCHGQ